jgi:hypothetical protein
MTNVPIVLPEGFTPGISTLFQEAINRIDRYQARGFDTAAGGSYTPTQDIQVSGANGGGFGTVQVHEQLHFKGDDFARLTLTAGTLPNLNNQDIGIASGAQLLRFVAPGGVYSHDMDNTGAVLGDFLMLQRVANPNTITIHKDGSSYAGPFIVQFPSNQFCSAMLYFDGTDWRLGMYSANCVVGVDA